MKPWLFVGAKVVALVDARHGSKAPKVLKGTVLTVGVINTSPRNNLCLGFDEVAPVSADIAAQFPECQGRWQYFAADFGPVSTIDTTKTVEALKQLMINGPQGAPVDWDKVSA